MYLAITLKWNKWKMKKSIFLESALLMLIIVSGIFALVMHDNSKTLSDIQLQDKNMSEQIESHLEDIGIDCSVSINQDKCRITFSGWGISGKQKYAAIDYTLREIVYYREGKDVMIFAYDHGGKYGPSISGQGSYNATSDEVRIWVPLYKKTCGPLED